jgi:general secretion pathway protein H
MRATSATGSRGFTLLELLVVLTITVLIAAAWPLASSQVFAAQHLRSESQYLAGAIRFAQMTARLSGAPQELVISPNGTEYRVASEVHELPPRFSLRVRVAAAEAADIPRFFLFPDGSSSGGTLTLSVAERVASFRVLPATGRLEMSL